MAFTYRDMGRAFHEHILRIFHYGWMDCRDTFCAVFLLILLCNRQNIAEYKAYWLMDAPIINPLGAHFTSYSPYFRNGWMDCRDTFHAVFFAYIAV